MTFATAASPGDAQSRSNTWILIGIASCIALLHLVTNGRYGFHRDELQFLSDARHLDWGFVSYPPLTPFLESILLRLFGVSQEGLRLFSVLAQAVAIAVTGLMARELGGGRLAQVAAALALALSPNALFEGTQFQYTSFDSLWWVLAAYSVIRVLRSGDPRWWLEVGAAIGLGLLTKYTILFFVAGILGGLLLTPARRNFLSGWFWAGVALALLLFLPNLLWQARHDFISYRFLEAIHARDVSIGRANGFFSQQFLICVNLFAAPLWIAGLVAAMRDRSYRPLGWMYLIPLGLFLYAQGRGFYLAPAYPMLLAMGATFCEGWLGTLGKIARRTILAVYFAGLGVVGLYFLSILLPFADSGPLREVALAGNAALREELGWDTMLQTLAQVRERLPASAQPSVGILVGNYGEQGAVEILGPAYHLPPPISGVNSAWLRGYPQPPPTTLIAVGVSPRFLQGELAACYLAARIAYPRGLKNEETRGHREIYVCGPPLRSWPDFWRDFQSFG